MSGAEYILAILIFNDGRIVHMCDIALLTKSGRSQGPSG